MFVIAGQPKYLNIFYSTARYTFKNYLRGNDADSDNILPSILIDSTLCVID